MVGAKEIATLIKKNVFLGEKRDPSERHANSYLRNLTHITQKPSYVYTQQLKVLKHLIFV